MGEPHRLQSMCPSCGMGQDRHDGTTTTGPPADGDVALGAAAESYGPGTAAALVRGGGGRG